MPITIEVANGKTAVFPDGTPQDKITKILDEDYPLDGKTIGETISNNPSYIPRRQDYNTWEKWSKEQGFDIPGLIQSAGRGLVDLMDAAVAGASAGAKGAALNPANYLEGAAQGTRSLYGLITESSNPQSPIFKLRDLMTGGGTPEARYNQFVEARKFANRSAELAAGKDGLLVDPQYTNPDFVEAVSLVADPMTLVPFAGELTGAGKLAAKAVGKGVAAVGKTTELVGDVGRSATKVAVREAGQLPVLGAVAQEADRTARMVQGIGDTTKQVGNAIASGPSRIGPIEAAGQAAGAAGYPLRERLLGAIGRHGGDFSLDAGVRAAAGAAEGAAIGGTLGYLNNGEEGLGQGIGAGIGMGAAGALAGRLAGKLTGKAATEARVADLERFKAGNPEHAPAIDAIQAKHGVDAATRTADTIDAAKSMAPGIQIELKDAKQFEADHGGKGRGVHLDKDPATGQPTAVINTDEFSKTKGDGPAYTLAHEIFHGMGGTEEVKQAILEHLGSQEVEARLKEYASKFPADHPEAAKITALGDPAAKADYVAGELGAEYFARLLNGGSTDSLLRKFKTTTRLILDKAILQKASDKLTQIAAHLDKTLGVTPTDSMLFPGLAQASPQINAMLRELVRTQRKVTRELANSKPVGFTIDQIAKDPVLKDQFIATGAVVQDPKTGDISFADNKVRNARARADGKAVIDALQGAGAKDPNGPYARVVLGDSNKPARVELSGGLSPEQVDAIKNHPTISKATKQAVLALHDYANSGKSVHTEWIPITTKGKDNATGSVNRYDLLPYVMEVSKDGSITTNNINLDYVRKIAAERMAKNGNVGPFKNPGEFMTALQQYLTNLHSGDRNVAKRSAELFGEQKANYLHNLITIQGGAEHNFGSKIFRKVRSDTVLSTKQTDFQARYSHAGHDLAKARWMPAQKLPDGEIHKSTTGQTIIHGNKWRLYDASNKLVGIYDTQLAAEAKASAMPRSSDIIGARNEMFNAFVPKIESGLKVSRETAELINRQLVNAVPWEDWPKHIRTDEVAKWVDSNAQGGMWEGDARFDPNHISGETDKRFIADGIVSAAKGSFPISSNGDARAYIAASASRLGELGGDYSDIARALDRHTTKESSSSADKAEYFKTLGERVMGVLSGAGISLPAGDLGKRPNSIR